MTPRSHSITLAFLSFISFWVFWNPAESIGGDRDLAIPTGRIQVAKKQESVQMIVSTSQYLSFPQPILTATINNPTVLKVDPTQKNELLVSALSTGVTQIDAKGLDDTVYNVQVIVIGDARELQSILAQHFPTATLHVQPIRDAVIISGQVTSDEHVEQVVTIAEEFYQRVINKIEVIGVHTIMLHTQIMEVSRTRLRQLGIDWSMGFRDDFVSTTSAGLIGAGGTTGALINAGNETFKVGIIDSGNSFFGLVRALRENKLAKVLADPTVVAIDGRPASFNSGGEFPIIVPAGLGQVGIEFREFGTRVDFVAKVRGDGRIWLEVRPMVSEIDPGRSVNIQGTSVPGLRSRFVDTSVELRAGQTLALAGLLQVRTEAESVGILGLADIPYLGALFRSNREVQNEVELLILVTPNFAAPMDPHEVPAGGPGYNSDSPLDKELYLHGHIEVPATCGPAGVTVSETHASGPTLYGAAYAPGADSYSASSAASKSRVPAQPVSTAKPVQLPVRR
ncbi:type II and III secretion system protein family protein [Pirellulaceae bacterium SH449]